MCWFFYLLCRSPIPCSFLFFLFFLFFYRYFLFCPWQRHPRIFLMKVLHPSFRSCEASSSVAAFRLLFIRVFYSFGAWCLFKVFSSCNNASIFFFIYISFFYFNTFFRLFILPCDISVPSPSLPIALRSFFFRFLFFYVVFVYFSAFFIFCCCLLACWRYVRCYLSSRGQRVHLAHGLLLARDLGNVRPRHDHEPIIFNGVSSEFYAPWCGESPLQPSGLLEAEGWREVGRDDD